ncbi:uncharacterized protein HKW66_Vig0077140 [Vigna angularis]|uniref:Uncharacterized protein n=1 Tax=Phaseolus angularis TaxID=3914 RepID=A0A8T0K5L7_PHAAN|nr:uncharacterized protein HKW66_Vig0077140 [Vigna angularis]
MFSFFHDNLSATCSVTEKRVNPLQPQLLLEPVDEIISFRVHLFVFSTRCRFKPSPFVVSVSPPPLPLHVLSSPSSCSPISASPPYPTRHSDPLPVWTSIYTDATSLRTIAAARARDSEPVPVSTTEHGACSFVEHGACSFVEHGAYNFVQHGACTSTTKLRNKCSKGTE